MAGGLARDWVLTRLTVVATINRGTADHPAHGNPIRSGPRIDGMGHSLKYQIAESASPLEIEVGKLLDVASMLEAAGSESLAVDVSIQAHKLLQVAIELRIAMAG